MRFVVDPKTAAWLEGLTGISNDFEWDAGNRTKHGKHGVASKDIESLFKSPVLFVGRITEPEHAEPRWLALGKDAQSRRLALIFTRRGNRVRAISCRSMRRNERKLYEEATHEPKET